AIAGPTASRNPVRKLRRLIGLLLPRRPRPRLGLRLRLRRGLLTEAAQAALEVVEDEPDRRLLARRRRDHAVAVRDHKNAPAAQRDVELDELQAFLGPMLLGRAQELERRLRQPAGALVVDRRGDDRPLAIEDDSRLDLGRDLRQVPERLGRRHDALTVPRPILLAMRWLPQPVRKFFADRGPHLAAMIAYFALPSFVPL